MCGCSLHLFLYLPSIYILKIKNHEFLLVFTQYYSVDSGLPFSLSFSDRKKVGFLFAQTQKTPKVISELLTHTPVKNKCIRVQYLCTILFLFSLKIYGQNAVFKVTWISSFLGYIHSNVLFKIRLGPFITVCIPF